MMDQVEPDHAEIDMPALRYAYLPQQIATSEADQEKTVWDYVSAGRPVDELQEKLNAEYEKLAKYPDSVAITNRINEIQDLMDSYDLANLEYDLLKITDEMKLGDLLDRKMKDLSGGQKRRVAIAGVIASVESCVCESFV